MVLGEEYPRSSSLKTFCPETIHEVDDPSFVLEAAEFP